LEVINARIEDKKYDDDVLYFPRSDAIIIRTAPVIIRRTPQNKKLLFSVNSN